MPKYAKSYTHRDDFTSFDVALDIVDFRRSFAYLGPIRIIVPVEKEWRLRGLKYEFFAMQGVEVEIGLIEPTAIEIVSLNG